eukprot:6035349-Prymnesium_polylepis.1
MKQNVAASSELADWKRLKDDDRAPSVVPTRMYTPSLGSSSSACAQSVRWWVMPDVPHTSHASVVIPAHPSTLAVTPAFHTCEMFVSMLPNEAKPIRMNANASETNCAK